MLMWLFINLLHGNGSPCFSVLGLFKDTFCIFFIDVFMHMYKIHKIPLFLISSEFKKKLYDGEKSFIHLPNKLNFK